MELLTSGGPLELEVDAVVSYLLHRHHIAGHTTSRGLKVVPVMHLGDVRLCAFNTLVSSYNGVVHLANQIGPQLSGHHQTFDGYSIERTLEVQHIIV